jgi:hypothetical protein
MNSRNPYALLKYLVAVVALGLGACGPAEDTAAAGVSSSVTSSTNASNASTSSNVSSSTNVTSSSTTSSTGSTSSGTGTTSCSAELNSKRCEVSCRAPEVAQCRNTAASTEPTCVCR